MGFSGDYTYTNKKSAIRPHTTIEIRKLIVK
jgi:hypothetical protein